MTKKTEADARMFFVDTRFQRLARRSGGISREQAISQAQAGIEEAGGGFDEWVDAELKDLVDLIKSAGAGRPAPDWLEAANFRSRQLRDVGTTMGFELLSFVADSLCDLLDSIADGAECNMESVVCHVDALVLSRQERYRHMQPDQVPDLTKGLRRVVKHVST
jgi:hypothetical protein